MEPTKSTHLRLQQQINKQAVKLTLKDGSSDLADTELLQFDWASVEYMQPALIQKSFPHLKELIFNQPVIFSLKDLKVFSKIPNLQALSLNNISPSSFSFPVFPNLRKLDINYFPFGVLLDANFSTKVPQLESLGWVNKLNSSIISSLQRLKGLRELKIGSRDIPDLQPTLKGLSGMVKALPNLTSLHFIEWSFDSAQLKTIADHIVSLKTLDIGYYFPSSMGVYQKITHEGLLHLEKHPLESLSIDTSNIYDQDMKIGVSSFPNLKELTLTKYQLTETMLDIIPKHLPNLERISMACSVKNLPSQSVIKLVESMGQLKELAMGNVMTKQSYIKICQSISQHLGKLENLQLSDLDTLVMNNSCFSLSRMKHLKHITLRSNTIGDVGMMKMLRNTHYTCSDFSKNKPITSKGERNSKVLRLNRHLIVRAAQAIKIEF